MSASSHGIAAIYRARVPVVTGGPGARYAVTVHAGISNGTGIAVFAPDAGQRLVIAPCLRITQIKRTNVIVETVCSGTGSAKTVHALVTSGALVSVIAVLVVVQVHTATLGITRFVSTNVAIVTVFIADTRNRPACSVEAIPVVSAAKVACATVCIINVSIHADLTTQNNASSQPRLFAGNILQTTTQDAMLPLPASIAAETAMTSIPTAVDALPATVHQPFSTIDLLLLAA
jgi:hypothetical protein